DADGSDAESEDFYEDLPNIMSNQLCNEEGEEDTLIMSDPEGTDDLVANCKMNMNALKSDSCQEQSSLEADGKDRIVFDEQEEKDNDANAHDEKGNMEESGELGPEMIIETGRLFIRNLSYLCTEEDLTRLFESFGPLSEVHLSISKESKKPKGF